MKSTHTYAHLEVSASTYTEIRGLLEKAGYSHAFDSETGAIDMHGIGLVAAAPPAAVEVVPDVQLDSDLAERAGHAAHNYFVEIENADGTTDFDHNNSNDIEELVGTILKASLSGCQDCNGSGTVLKMHANGFTEYVTCQCIRNAVEKDDEETYQLGKRDGYEEAVQDIDIATGGDGEYRYCMDGDPDRHTPDAATMRQRIIDRFITTPAPAASPVVPDFGIEVPDFGIEVPHFAIEMTLRDGDRFVQKLVHKTCIEQSRVLFVGKTAEDAYKELMAAPAAEVKPS